MLNHTICHRHELIVSDRALSMWCLINLREVMRAPHACSRSCSWAAIFGSSPCFLLLILCILRPTSPPPHHFFHAASSCHIYVNSILYWQYSVFLSRKRHHSCDSEEDQQLALQAKRSATTPSLLVSDLDSEVFTFTWSEILESWCFGARVFLFFFVLSDHFYLLTADI